MTCSKGPQIGIKPWAAAARTQPLYMGHMLRVYTVYYCVDILEILNYISLHEHTHIHMHADVN